jgi:two-component system, NarL family, response regulator DegU
MKKLRIVIADDHPIFRGGVKDILSREDWIEVVAEAENGMEAYQKILAELPDIAILDLEMPMINGLDVCKKVLNEKNNTSFIILTMHKEKQFYDEAIKAGVKGYLLKDNATADLIHCIQEVAKGNSWVVQQLQHLQKSNNDSLELEKVNSLLTPTEKMIITLISQGKTSNEIGALLFISPNTVENHRSNMNKKLQLEGKNSLLKFAMSIADEL